MHVINHSTYITEKKNCILWYKQEKNDYNKVEKVSFRSVTRLESKENKVF